MTERSGQMLAHYRLLEKIGEGGMGLVYKALDTRLQRHAAIKILPSEVTSDPERRARFQREAQAAAALNHPNIAVVYEIDEHDGAQFIAMELVEGKALRAVMDEGQMDPQRAVMLALQMADGISRAHQAGIVHRDLKPENVIINMDDRVKILDFGLAKLKSDSKSDAGFSAKAHAEMATISAEMTREGKILGTAAYMSPEQARGESVDHRSDIFSFGINVYEMVTGRTPFVGQTPMDTLSSILKDEVLPPTGLNPNISGELERILEKCLEKNVDDRYQNTSDLVVDLKRLRRKTESQPIAMAEAATAKKNMFMWLAAILGGLGLVAVLAMAGMQLGWFGETPPEPLPDLRPRRMTANPAENWVTDGDISPDGKFLAYADQTGLHLQEVDTGESRDLPLPDGTIIYSLAWFPDGSKLVTSETSIDGQTALWAISILSGDRRILQENARQASVAPDGMRIAFLGGPNTWSTREIWVMGAEGDNARKVIAAGGLELFSQPAWSPDSERIAFVKYTVAEAGAGLSAFLQTVDALDGLPPVTATQWKMTVEQSPPVGEAVVCWLADGRVIMARGEDLFDVQVDPRSGVASGEARRISNWNGIEPHELSISSDGSRLAFQNVQVQVDVFVGALSDGGRKLASPKRITLDDRRDYNPAWTSDSQSILFHSDRRGTWDIFRQEIASRNAQSVVTGATNEIAPRLGNQDDLILFWQLPPGEGGSAPPKLMRAPIDGGPATLVLEAGAGAGLPQFRCSAPPDGRCLLGEHVGGSLNFTEFDPLTGRGSQAASVPLGGSEQAGVLWDLSPDGQRLAMVQEGGRIRLLHIDDDTGRDFKIDGARGYDHVAWTADGKGLFIIGRDPGAVILHVAMNGKTTRVWETSRTIFLSLAPSPDGRYLAVAANSLDSDIWMVEGI